MKRKKIYVWNERFLEFLKKKKELYLEYSGRACGYHGFLGPDPLFNRPRPTIQ